MLFDTLAVPMLCSVYDRKVKAMAATCPSVALGISVILLAGLGAAFADESCYCRTATGDRVAVGGTACLKTSGGMQEARCGFVLNNPSWKFTGRPCPQAWHGGAGKAAGLASVRGR